jgi:hypothetical protein
MLSGDEHSIIKGWEVMLEANRAKTGIWQQAVAQKRTVYGRHGHI